MGNIKLVGLIFLVSLILYIPMYLDILKLQYKVESLESTNKKDSDFNEN